MSISIPSVMLGPFPGTIIGAIPFEIPIAIHSVMSSSIPGTIPGESPTAIPYVVHGYFPSTHFGANTSIISNAMSDFF